MKKPMVYKSEDGTMYKISFSEELQLKNLKASRKQIKWQKRAFMAQALLAFVLFILSMAVIYVFYRLDQVNFFTKIMYGG